MATPIETHLVQLDADTMAIMSWAKDGKGKKWKDVSEYTAKLPPVNGRKGTKGWRYEWRITYDKESDRYVMKRSDGGRLPK